MAKRKRTLKPSLTERSGRNSPPTFSPRRRWLYRLLLVTAAPALFFCLLEGALRLFHYGYPTTYFVPSADGKSLTTNRRFACQFHGREHPTYPHPIQLTKEKPPGAQRIFILGESAAEGTPDPAFGFGRILEVMLQRQYPGRQIEVVNVAMRGIDSHIIRLIAMECADLKPDLFILYMGNNDVIGTHGPDATGFTLVHHLKLLRLGQWIKAMRTTELLSDALRAVHKPKATAQTMEFFRAHQLPADHPRRLAVYQNYRANLKDIAQAFQAAGATGILATVPVNLKDFPPLGSLHRPGLPEPDLARWQSAFTAGISAANANQPASAVLHFNEALKLDDHFAELHFRLAGALTATGQFEKAWKHYELALDWDALQYRSGGEINDIVRELGTNGVAGVAEVERAFASSPLSEHGVPGDKLFHDHVHLTFEGDYLVASTLLPSIVSGLKLGPSPAALPSKVECAAALAYTRWDEINVAQGVAASSTGAPFLDQVDYTERQRRKESGVILLQKNFRVQDAQVSAKTYAEAILLRPNDWQLHFNYGKLLEAMKNDAAAFTEFSTVAKLVPDYLAVRLELMQLLVRNNRDAEAAEHFNAAVRIDPDSPQSKDAQKRARGGK